MAEENKTWWFGRFKIIILSNTHVILGNLNIFYEYLWLFYEVMFPVLPMILLLILMWFYLKGIEPEQYYLTLYIRFPPTKYRIKLYYITYIPSC